MSEFEIRQLADKLRGGLKIAHKKMLERKALLGETIIIADADGQPLEISAQEALNRLISKQ